MLHRLLKEQKNNQGMKIVLTAYSREYAIHGVVATNERRREKNDYIFEVWFEEKKKIEENICFNHLKDGWTYSREKNEDSYAWI